MKEFKLNPNYLLFYCIAVIALFGVVDLVLFLNFGFRSFSAFTFHDVVYPILAFMACSLPSSIMHNCAHSNVGNKKINRLTGEFCGTIMLYGFRGFSLGHLFHHIYPDNPKYDPHPPRGISFPVFLVSPIKATLDVVETAYYEVFGKNEKTIRNVFWQKIFFNIGIVFKIVFWLLLLGPKLFLIFYLPLYLSNIFVFAHINYATHIEREDGQAEIINLTKGLYYRLINQLSFGGYYHKNHHANPKLFNPSKGTITEKPLLTYQFSKAQTIESAPLEISK